MGLAKKINFHALEFINHQKKVNLNDDFLIQNYECLLVTTMHAIVWLTCGKKYLNHLRNQIIQKFQKWTK